MSGRWNTVLTVVAVSGVLAGLAWAQPSEKRRPKDSDKQQEKQPAPESKPDEKKPEKQQKAEQGQNEKKVKEGDKPKDGEKAKEDDSKGKGRGEWRQRYREELKGHPRLGKALVELHVAKQHLESAGHDFGGNKAAAIKACDEAIAKVREAMKFDAAHSDEEDDQGKSGGGDAREKEKSEKEDHGKGKGKDGEKKPGKK